MRGNPLAYFPAVGNLATVQRVMANLTQHPAVGRDIEPARRARNYVMALELFVAGAALTAPTIPPQDIGP